MAKEKPLCFVANLSGKAKIIVLEEQQKAREKKIIRGKSMAVNILLTELYEIKNKK